MAHRPLFNSWKTVPIENNWIANIGKEQMFALEEVLINAHWKGNWHHPSKNVYFLWNKSSVFEEFYVVDSGENFFDYKEIMRNDINIKKMRQTGLSCLVESFKDVKFSAIMNEGNKIGTMLYMKTK